MDPIGWPSDISQDSDFGLDESTSWGENESAARFVEAFFFVPPQPVLTWRPDPARVEESVLFRTLVTEFESGREQRRSRGRPRRRWRVQFRKDQVDAGELWAFYLARNGPVDPFLWENPADGRSYVVRFPEAMSRRVLWRAAYEIGLELIEVI